MRKLEDIPRRSVFKVPEGYFEDLPTQIQSRMAEGGRRSPALAAVSFSLKFALPVLALVVAGIFWFRPQPTFQDELNDIDSDQIALYLERTENADLDDTHDPADWTKPELDQLEDAVYSNMEYPNEDLLDELDLENL